MSTRSPISSTKPSYAIKARNHGADDLEVEIWQLPSTATPHLAHPLRLAGLRGRNLALVETQLLRYLKKAGAVIAPRRGEVQKLPVDEDIALNVGLLCRTLAPMRNPTRMRQIATGIEAMNREEAAYWLGMAMHRKNPRRVLSALRLLLTTPN